MVWGWGGPAVPAAVESAGAHGVSQTRPGGCFPVDFAHLGAMPSLSHTVQAPGGLALTPYLQKRGPREDKGAAGAPEVNPGGVEAAQLRMCQGPRELGVAPA